MATIEALRKRVVGMSWEEALWTCKALWYTQYCAPIQHSIIHSICTQHYKCSQHYICIQDHDTYNTMRYTQLWWTQHCAIHSSVPYTAVWRAQHCDVYSTIECLSVTYTALCRCVCSVYMNTSCFWSSFMTGMYKEPYITVLTPKPCKSALVSVISCGVCVRRDKRRGSEARLCDLQCWQTMRAQARSRVMMQLAII